MEARNNEHYVDLTAGAGVESADAKLQRERRKNAQVDWLLCYILEHEGYVPIRPILLRDQEGKVHKVVVNFGNDLRERV